MAAKAVIQKIGTPRTSTIPEELIMEIFLRVPAKSLLRFRCLSKSWRAQIDSPKFIRMHSDQSAKRGSTGDIIIVKDSEVYSLDFDTRDSCTAKKLIKFPCQALDLDTQLQVSCCRGILCLSNLSRDRRDFSGRDESFTWLNLNPSTGTGRYCSRKVLCNAENGQGLVLFRALTNNYFFVGYDHLNDDFKVVRLVQYIGLNKHRYVFTIYSLRTKSWKEVEAFPFFNCKADSGVFIDGTNAMHWIVSKTTGDNNGDSITALNFETERFSVVPFPDSDHDGDKLGVAGLGSFEGRLYLCQSWARSGIIVWVMKEYGIKDSWTKLILLENSYGFLKPLAYSESGRQLLVVLDDEEMHWYHLQEKSLTRVTVSGLPITEAEAKNESQVFCLCSRNLFQLEQKN